MRLALVTLLLIGSLTPAFAKLQIKDVQASHGQLGPERKDLDYVRGDELYVRFTVVGLRDAHIGWNQLAPRVQQRRQLRFADILSASEGEFETHLQGGTEHLMPPFKITRSHMDVVHVEHAFRRFDVRANAATPFAR